jgi:hypothetical protein
LSFFGSAEVEKKLVSEVNLLKAELASKQVELDAERQGRPVTEGALRAQIGELERRKVDPVEKIMLSRSIELSDANPPKAPTGAAAVDVLPPIACHGGTRDSFLGFIVCRTRQLTQETVDLYWFGPS